MSDEEFNINKASLATRRLEKPKDMTTLYTYFWTEIVTQQYNFDRTTIEVAYLMTLTKDQILHFAKVNYSIFSDGHPMASNKFAPF